MTLIRATAVAFLTGLPGLVADPKKPDDFAAYCALIAPGETPERAAEMARASDCGLVAAGVWRALLARCPAELRAPYRTGMALVDLHEAARVAGALRDRHHEAQPGDLVHVGAALGACEHVFTVYEVHGDGWISSVDGGQRTPAGLETILVKRRRLEEGLDYLEGGSVRPILEIVDLEALADYYGIAA